MSSMVNETQKAIFLIMGGRNSYNMLQAAQKDAQKSQNLLYHVSLNNMYRKITLIPHPGPHHSTNTSAIII